MDDLISRAALLNDLSYCAPELWQDEEYVKAKIMKQPAVDAALVIHGRWVYEHADPAMIPCSVCGYQVFRYNNTHYCPNCGAKMMEDQHLAFADQSGAEYAGNPVIYGVR